MAKWCGVVNVLRLLSASTLAWSLHFATPFECATSSAKCVSPSIPSPTLLFYHTPFCVCLCVALPSDIHALFVAVDAFVLASVHLIWDTPCLPSTTACVVMVFLHYPGPVNHLSPFLCVFWCIPQATASICTDRGGYALWCGLPQKSAMRDNMKRHTPTHFAFFRFLSSPFLWRIWRQ